MSHESQQVNVYICVYICAVCVCVWVAAVDVTDHKSSLASEDRIAAVLLLLTHTGRVPCCRHKAYVVSAARGRCGAPGLV